MISNGADFAQFADDVAKAMAAGITALRFFSLPEARATEAVVVNNIIGSLPGSDRLARGFVWMSKPDMANVGNKICFTEVSGFDSVADHSKWKDTPDGADITKATEPLSKDMGLKALDVLGKRRSWTAGSGIVHVAFAKIA